MTTVTITTAVSLSKSQLKTVTDAIKAKYGADLSIEQLVDPEVVGGVKITIGSKQLDATIQNQLSYLKNQLLNI